MCYEHNYARLHKCVSQDKHFLFEKSVLTLTRKFLLSDDSEATCISLALVSVDKGLLTAAVQ